MATASVNVTEDCEDLGLPCLFSEIESLDSAITSQRHTKTLAFVVHTILRDWNLYWLRRIPRWVRAWTGFVPALLRHSLRWLPFFRKSQIYLAPPAPDLDEVLKKLRGKSETIKSSIRKAEEDAVQRRTEMDTEKKKYDGEIASLQADLDKERERTKRIEQDIATTTAEAFKLRIFVQEAEVSLSSAHAEIEANRRYALRLLSGLSSTYSSSTTCSICAEELVVSCSHNRPSATCSEGHVFCIDCLSRLARTHRFYGAGGLLCPFEETAARKTNSNSNSNSNSNVSSSPETLIAASGILLTGVSQSDPALGSNSNSNEILIWKAPRWNFNPTAVPSAATATPISSSHVIPEALLAAVLSSEDIAAYRLAVSLAAFERSRDCQFCPACNRPSLDAAPTDSDSDSGAPSTVQSCPYEDCKALFCTRCRSVTNHVQLHRCQKPFRELFLDDSDPDATDEEKRRRLLIECTALLAAADVVECPRCGLCIQRVDGCRHMRCIHSHNGIDVGCRYEFCWLCGGPYPSCDCEVVNSFTGGSLADSITSSSLRTAVGEGLGLSLDGDAVTALARRQSKLERIAFELRGRRELVLLKEVFEGAQRDNVKMFEHLVWRENKSKDKGAVMGGTSEDGGPNGTAAPTSSRLGLARNGKGDVCSDGCDPSRSGIKYQNLVGMEVVPGPHWKGDTRFLGKGIVYEASEDEVGQVKVDWVTSPSPSGSRDRFPWPRSRDRAIQAQLGDEGDAGMGSDPDSDPGPPVGDAEGEGSRGWARQWSGSERLPEVCYWGRRGRFEVALADPFAQPLRHAPASKLFDRRAIQAVTQDWSEQDAAANGVGTIVSETRESRDWVRVQWPLPRDEEVLCQWWVCGHVDVVLLDPPSGYDFVGLRVPARDLAGRHVIRGDDWMWGDQDLSPEASGAGSAASSAARLERAVEPSPAPAEVVAVIALATEASSMKPSAASESSSEASGETSSAASAEASKAGAAEASGEASSKASSAASGEASNTTGVSLPTEGLAEASTATTPEASPPAPTPEASPETAPAEDAKANRRTGLVVAVPGGQWKDGMAVPEGWVLVAWDEEGRHMNLYRWGHEGKFDLSLYVPDKLRSSYRDMIYYIYRSQPHIISKMHSAAAPKSDQEVQTEP